MFLKSIALICTVIFMASYLSPQIGFYGRGLRLGLPAFCLAVAVTALCDIGVIWRVLSRNVWVFVLGSIFVLQAFLRCLTIGAVGYDTDALVSVYVYGVTQVLMAAFLVLLIREFGFPYLNVLAHAVFVVAAVSLCLGVPVLLDRPGVARDVMRMGLLGYARLEYRSGEGVGTYTQYTGIAILFFPLIVWLAESRGWWRLVYLVLLLGLAMAVMLSTFTMAAVFLAMAVLAGLAYWVLQNRILAVPKITAIVVVGFLVAGTVIAAASENKAFTFVYDKAGLLWDRVSGAGIVQGDQTGRGAMVVQDWEDFTGNPVVGPIGGLTNITLGTGHSSLFNTLAINGLPCALLWCASLYLLARETIRGVRTDRIRLAIVLTWALLFASGIVNPTWHFPSMTATVLLYALLLKERDLPVANPRLASTSPFPYGGYGLAPMD